MTQIEALFLCFQTILCVEITQQIELSLRNLNIFKQLNREMQKQSFKDLANESEEAFRNQFDPNSATFHHGSNVPVPLHGDRVPESMSTMYPEGYDPNKATEVVDYGEAYRKVQTDRSVYLNLKKSLAKLCPVVEAFLRHDQIFKDKGDPNNQNHIKVHQENIKKQKENLQQVNAELESYLSQLDNIGEEGKGLAKELGQIIDESKKEYNNKESLGNFNFKVKKLSTQAFSNAQKCLQKLKDIKKEHATNAKKQEAASPKNQ